MFKEISLLESVYHRKIIKKTTLYELNDVLVYVIISATDNLSPE